MFCEEVGVKYIEISSKNNLNVDLAFATITYDIHERLQCMCNILGCSPLLLCPSSSSIIHSLHPSLVLTLFYSCSLSLLLYFAVLLQPITDLKNPLHLQKSRTMSDATSCSPWDHLFLLSSSSSWFPLPLLLWLASLQYINKSMDLHCRTLKTLPFNTPVFSFLLREQSCSVQQRKSAYPMPKERNGMRTPSRADCQQIGRIERVIRLLTTTLSNWMRDVSCITDRKSTPVFCSPSLQRQIKKQFVYLKKVDGNLQRCFSRRWRVSHHFSSCFKWTVNFKPTFFVTPLCTGPHHSQHARAHTYTTPELSAFNSFF